jgi:hypothetical protein
MSLTRLAGFKNCDPNPGDGSQIMASWFEGTAACDIRQAAPPGAPLSFIRSLRQITKTATTLPPLPGMEAPPGIAQPAVEEKPISAYERMDNTLSRDSYSSHVLSKHGILERFLSESAVLDISMSPDGSLTACVRSADGFKRTVICRQNGSTSQRVTSSDGRELVRFASDGKVYLQI